VRVFTALCLVASLAHVSLVFLHVAPPNPLSQRYSKQINAWVYPLFEQNWRLFAPNPESVNRQISARTAHTDEKGAMRVSGWFDLTGVDNSATEHNPFPSHTTQNLLRRAWTSYVETHGGDDQSRSERAAMIHTYLRNIAVDRIAAHRPGAFESVQLRVITLPITASAAADDRRPADSSRPKPVETRYLPWWKVTSRAK
jgi:hypothetical protein